ncbi:hypothetical protein BH23GEM7_BH23GEM7_28390 [soil metagenome]|nr:hypothetical protein [Gemmatimonadota bacterium]
MERNELLQALRRLGELVPPGTEILLAGGAALILAGYIERGTDDGDVVHSQPSLATLSDSIAAVAEERNLSTRWLNDGVKAWSDVLPADFEARLEEVGTFGDLRVRRLGRLDLLVMKFFALREEDLEDLERMAPTDEEIAFVRSQLGRIARIGPDKALRMQLYLDQGEDLRSAPTTERGDPIPREGKSRDI